MEKKTYTEEELILAIRITSAKLGNELAPLIHKYHKVGLWTGLLIGWLGGGLSVWIMSL
jgi:hypothetical protein